MKPPLGRVLAARRGDKYLIHHYDGVWWLIHPTGLRRPHTTWGTAVSQLQAHMKQNGRR